MKSFYKVSVAISVIAFGLTGSISVFAATAPTLGVAASYAVFGKAGVTNDSNVGTTHIWGNVGADAINVTNLNDATQVDGIIDNGVGVEAAILTTYGQLAAIPDLPVVLNLAGNNTVAPGVYNVGATTLNGVLTLSGAGVYVFRSSSSIDVTAGVGAEVKLTNGADACNVFWQIPASMTIGAGAKMVGTIVADTALISLGTNATLQGRALSRIAQVTMLGNQITEPTCTPPPPVVSGPGGPGGSYSPPPAPSVVATGAVTATGTATGTIVISTPLSRPIINIKKVPSRLTPFPFGGGNVTYTYTVTNPGKVGMSSIIVTDDKCSPVYRVSGDLNKDNILDLTEKWTYKCHMNISVSTKNIATAEGKANGFTVRRSAIANVYVGFPTLPNTGIPPEESNTPWSMIMFSVLALVISSSAFLIIRNQNI